MGEEQALSNFACPPPNPQPPVSVNNVTGIDKKPRPPLDARPPHLHNKERARRRGKSGRGRCRVWGCTDNTGHGHEGRGLREPER